MSFSVSERRSKETRLEELKEEVIELNRHFINKNSEFNLKKIDKEIKKMKRQKNDEKDKEACGNMNTVIKEMKKKRWEDFNELKILRQEVKKKRREEYIIRGVSTFD